MSDQTPPVTNESSNVEAEETSPPAVTPPSPPVVLPEPKGFRPHPMTHWLNRDDEQVDEAMKSISDLMGGRLPAFAVVGMGRCGCHVTSELAEMISSAHPSKRIDTEAKPKGSWLSNMFGGNSAAGVLSFVPLMIVGDIDETTFDDVRGLLTSAGAPADVIRKILALRYSPLAEGGAGHVPPFAEFLTRALLSQPPRATGDATPDWLPARTYLIDGHLRESERTRLFFYIFSTGGGTGAGSAAEVMRAQRYSMCVSELPEPQIYFTGVAILPEGIRKNRKHLINTGRTLLQYLADLNVRLDGPLCYEEAPVFDGRHRLTTSAGEKHLMPWEGLALISNDVMSANSGAHVTQEEMEANANQYIAQQIFNLSAAQLPVASFEEDSNVRVTKKNYQSIRLDPQDLKTSLAGPYGICFAAATAKELQTDGDLAIDRMLVRALGLPTFHEARAGDETVRFIEGISIAPEEKPAYIERVARLAKTVCPNEGSGTPLTAKDFEPLREVPIYEKCPRAVFVLTAPQEGEISAQARDRIATLLSWLMPNLDQTRSAIVRGTTSHHTLSIYIESSVVLCPDVQSSIKNYLKLCWGQRRGGAQEFIDRFDALMDQEPPIGEAEVMQWLGEEENYGINVPNFAQAAEEIETRWSQYVETHCEDAERRERLRALTISGVNVTAADVTAALRFLNYIRGFSQPELV